MSTPANANAVHGVVADEDICLASRALDIRMLGGWAMGLFENHFIGCSGHYGPTECAAQWSGGMICGARTCADWSTPSVAMAGMLKSRVDYGRVSRRTGLQPAAAARRSGRTIRIDGAS